MPKRANLMIAAIAGSIAMTLLLPIARAEYSTIERCFLLTAFDPNDESVNVRRSPNGEMLTEIPNLTRVETFGPAFIELGWTKVRLPEGTQGYIWSKLLRYAVYQVFDPSDRAANLRKTPNGTILQAVPNATEVEFMGSQGDWMRVRLQNGVEGYIDSALLRPPSCF